MYTITQIQVLMSVCGRGRTAGRISTHINKNDCVGRKALGIATSIESESNCCVGGTGTDTHTRSRIALERSLVLVY